jgi:hypothetical protein
MNLKDPQIKSEENQYLAISNAAALLHVHPETLRRYEAKGFIKSQKTVGGHRRYLENDVLILKEDINQGILRSGSSYQGSRDNKTFSNHSVQQSRNQDYPSTNASASGSASQSTNKKSNTISFQEKWLQEKIASISSSPDESPDDYQVREQEVTSELSIIKKASNFIYHHQKVLSIAVDLLAVLVVLAAIVPLFFETQSLVIFLTMIAVVAGTLIASPLLATLIFGYLIALIIPFLYYLYWGASSEQSLLAGISFIVVSIVVVAFVSFYSWLEMLGEYK